MESNTNTMTATDNYDINGVLTREGYKFLSKDEKVAYKASLRGQTTEEFNACKKAERAEKKAQKAETKAALTNEARVERILRNFPEPIEAIRYAQDWLRSDLDSLNHARETGNQKFIAQWEEAVNCSKAVSLAVIKSFGVIVCTSQN